MSVLKVIKVQENSTLNFEDAVSNVIAEASKSVKNIKSLHVKDMQVSVDNNQIKEYRINTKNSFGIVDD